MSQYKYKQNWFNLSEIKQRITQFVNPLDKNTILEIGCFEGLSSVFFADNLLNHNESSLTCIDPFLKIENNDHKELLLENAEENFDYNISICKNSSKIIIKKITSDEFFKNNTNIYNFIYIDGCHEPEFIKRDMLNSFKILEKGGVMWMDDYGGGDGVSIRNAMDNILESLNGQFKLIHKGYQLAIQKL
jgi:predicted O-methyltransferase YrrM